ncbi:MAG TPA: ribonuclease P protein component [Thermoanaerobaculia bacterium]|nr:ribonuclease P protein component [Thermoanaerobaculia bacterium]
MSGSRLPGVSGSQRLLPKERLRRRADYLRCYRTGRRRHGVLAILYFAPNQLGHPRLGITASRKVGPAVVRQRIKRRIKEVYRRWKDRGHLPALDLVVHLKPEARGADFQALSGELLRLFSGLLPRRSPEPPPEPSTSPASPASPILPKETPAP